MAIVLDGTTGITTPAETVSGTGVWSIGGTQIYKDSSGNVGIGTGSPLAKLHVNGTILLPNAYNLASRNAANSVSLALIGRNSSDQVVIDPDGYGTVIGASSALQLNGSGNLGLGVTPSAWASPFANGVFEFGGGFLAPSAVNQTFRLGQNHYYNGSSYIYKANGPASAYLQNSGAHQWLNAPSGTAGTTASFTYAMTLDASGNLGLGVTNPRVKADVVGSINVSGDSGLSYTFTGLTNRYISGSNTAYLQSLDVSSGTVNGGKLLSFDASQILFRVISGSSFDERARIDSSGNFNLGDPGNFGAKLSIAFNPANQNGIVLGVSSGTFTNNYIYFQNSAGNKIGSVSSNNSTVTYNTTSDYRIKTNIQPITGALNKVAKLNPVTYDWKPEFAKGSSQGFIAHELQAVVPDCVTGEKDAVDKDGNPKYQGIDTSFLVATLTAAIQELKEIVDTQAAKIAALENK